MNKRALFLIPVLVFALSLGGLSLMEREPAPPLPQTAAAQDGAADPAPAIPAGRLLSCDYYVEETFMRSVREARAYQLDGRLAAGVVPHHLLAGRLIASFFATAADSAAAAGEDYESVVFVAPSHYPTAERAVSALGSWQTPFGVVKNDRQITDRLLGGTLAARADEENMQLDHAVSGLIPYVKYYLPKAKVSAVLLQNRLEPERVEALAAQLAAIAGEKKILLVCSVDFSHYLTPQQAALHDKQTAAALEAFDYRAIAGFTDSNMDSPQSVTVFLRYLQSQGIGEVRFFDHSSADKILGLPSGDPAYRDGVTTYFILGGIK